MYGRRVFPEFVRFLGPDNFTVSANVKIAFCLTEAVTEQKLQCDLNEVFLGVYQHLILDIIRNTAQAQQSKTTTLFQQPGRNRFVWSRGLLWADRSAERISMVCLLLLALT